MARENRSANRAAAAEAAKPTSGSEFDEIVTQSETDEEEPEFAFEEQQDENEDELESESVKAAPEGSENGDEDKAEAEVTLDETKIEAKADEVATGEKPADGEVKVDEKAVAEPTVEEPAPVAEVKAAEKPIQLPQDENLSDEQAAELFTNWRTTTEDLLAKHHYKLSDADVDAFNENPAEFIPRYASKVYLDSISAAFQQFVTYLPRMVDQVLEQRTVSSTNEQSFFGRWPELSEHKQVVARLGKAYRTENPSASVEDFINEVGAQAMVALRKTPAANAATPPPSNGKAKSFKPASNGPANERMQQRAPANQWDRLTEEFGTEDISEEDL